MRRQVKFNLWLSARLRDAIHTMAESREDTATALVRRYVEEGLKRDRREMAREEKGR